jgi:hypothetical protein
VLLLQLLVKMLHREAFVVLLIKPQHAQDLRDRRPLARRPAEPPIQQTRRPLVAQPIPPALKRPLRDPQHLRRLDLAQLSPFVPVSKLSNRIRRTPCSTSARTMPRSLFERF